MVNKFIETLSWGITASSSAVIISAILDFDKKSLRNIVVGAFILGCIRGYTGKNIVVLLCEGF
jgi:hypothetical protein